MPAVNDNFNRADTTVSLGTATSGQVWSEYAGGGWGIQSNRAYRTSSASNMVAALPTTDITNQVVQATIAVAGSNFGIVARVSDQDNFILFQWASGLGFRFFKRVAATWTGLAADVPGTPANGDVFRLDCNGNSLSAYRNGVLIFGPITDAALNTNTRGGLYTSNDTTTRFDDFSVTEFGASSGTLSGTATLNVITASGSFISSASSLSGTATLAAILASGNLGTAPGAVAVPELRNWGGSLQAGITIPVVTVCRLTTGAQVLTLTNQTTDGSGNLSITNAALVPGTAYMVIGWNADGSQRFAVPLTAT